MEQPAETAAASGNVPDESIRNSGEAPGDTGADHALLKRIDWRLAGKLSVIAGLIVAQILPSSLILTLLPIVMRDIGIPLEHFYLLGIAASPVWIKWLIAPLVDRTGSRRFGMRRSWIVPTTCLGFVAYLVIAQIEPSPTTIYAVIGVLFVKNLIMSLQDVAVDGYTVENIESGERSLAALVNQFALSIALLLPQVVLMLIYESAGWTFVITVAATCLLLLTAPVMLRDENPPSRQKQERLAHARSISLIEHSRETLLGFLKRPESKWILLVMVSNGIFYTFTIGLISAFLFDIGLNYAEIGLISGPGLILSPIIGGALGRWWLKRHGLRGLLVNGAASYTLTMLGFTYFAWVGEMTLATGIVFAIIGMSLIIPFGLAFDALRFKWASTDQAGTDYTIQSSFTLGSRGIGTALAGFAAGSLGYTLYFASSLLTIGIMLWIFLLLVPKINEAMRRARLARGDDPDDELVM